MNFYNKLVGLCRLAIAEAQEAGTVSEMWTVDDAITETVDSQLIYTSDILDLAARYLDATAILGMFYDDLIADITEELGRRDKE